MSEPLSQWEEWVKNDTQIQCSARWVQNLLEENLKRASAIANEALQKQHAQWVVIAKNLVAEKIQVQHDYNQVREAFGEAIKRGMIMSLDPLVLAMNPKKPQ